MFLRKSTRTIEAAFIHCTATMPYMDVRIETVRDWHMAPKPKGRGWDRVGYHGLICRDGEFEVGCDIDKPAWHAKGHNTNSIGICLAGGLNKEKRPAADFTIEQWVTLARVCCELERVYPNIKILGHNEVSAKACPSFDVQEFMRFGRVKEVA